MSASSSIRVKSAYKEQQKKKRAEEEAGLLTVPDGWKEPPFTPEDNPNGLFAKSSFATLFPKYREQYIRECWPLIQRKFASFNLLADLDVVEGTMTVSTTRKTWDPFIVLKARDVLRLLARSVPYQQAVRVLEDDVSCDVIKLNGFVSKRERFVRRRARLIGPAGATLKAIELLTGCYVLVQGHTVAAIGSHRGLREARKVIEDCMSNVHPIYNIKSLMIKHELAKDERLRNENWERFLPEQRPKSARHKKKPMPKASADSAAAPGAPSGSASAYAPAATSGAGAGHLRPKRPRREYTPFPPPQPPSRKDIELETGEYFLGESQRRAKRLVLRKEREKNVAVERKAQRAKAFEPPLETPTASALPKKSTSSNSSASKHNTHSCINHF